MSEKKEIIDKYIDETNKKNIPDKLPAIATRAKMLIYPNTVIPMFVGREKSIKALEESLEKYENYIFLVSQKKIEEEEPKVKDLYRVGTVARIVQLSKLPNGDYKVLVEGIKRAKIKKTVESKKIFMFEIEMYNSDLKTDKKIEALVRKIKELLKKYMELTKKFPQEAILAIEETSEPEIISDLVASIMPVDLDEKQKMLEIQETKKRLEYELEILAREIELLEIEESLESTVREKIEKNQKEFYLREKLNAIKEELDGKEDDEIKELQQKLKEGDYPDFVIKKAEKEIDRLNRMSPYSAEATVIRTYLDWILEIPWNKKSQDNLNIKEAKKILENNHYGLEEPKERILEFLSVRQLSKNSKAPILCFVGAPGVGKTTLGKSIADATGRKFGRISLGGVRDEAEIRGHRRTYVGAIPGRIVETIRKTGTMNPVIVLDEVDKLGTSFQGDPSAALLEVLDPQQNKDFTDHYLELPLDLSEVIFVTTANVIHTIPPALRDRMEVIYISGYTDIEKFKIAKKHIIPKTLKEHGLTQKEFNISDTAVKEIITNYTREAGVRSLEKTMAKVMRKSALKYVQKNKKINITVSNIHKTLGAAPFFDSKKNEKPDIGVVTGLAWTAYGGVILDVEVATITGKGRLITTGQLGDVMKESAKIALSLSRKIVEKMDKKYCEEFDKNDFHIHLPEGAVPKDGPSAGVTLTTAIISSILKKKVRNDIAMTGEITLRGKVLPVGGIKEKVLSAYRSGIYEVIIPQSNEKDVEKIPEEIRRKIKFNFAKEILEVLEIALIGGVENENK
ncbi:MULTISPECIES: endopeptidase La [Oceanotoga]|jgi:ATP-dependent Lon protease|uniref:Lon protease n=1 Tax=Oceanotoga teriensis TaxID=515440 RepID=A0AA45C8I4_9BACT|nr:MULTISPECIES: endopeptidase La [Oceanotoga]MDN5343752.1 ATP-dependent Lon protease [Oceanotoga sp.]MDO7975554.1 endopeptidase La [Oceanotoga teriensis]PWJ96157.1 ATP-dependent proteinase [Oceanotoga teriensis]